MRRSILVILVATAATLGSTVTGGAYPRPGKTTLASVASDGTQQRRPGVSLPVCFPFFDISANGRFVAFSSPADNLVAGDDNNACDVFRHDRLTGKTVRVSIASDGTEGRGACRYGNAPDYRLEFGSDAPSMSHDGRYIAFGSCAINLVPGDTNLSGDFFVHDARRGTTVRVSVASNGLQAINPDPTTAMSYCRTPSMSDDGRHVAFDSYAPNLVPDDTNLQVDAFVHHMRSKKTVRASLTSDEEQLDGGLDVAGACPSINADGRYVAFESSSDELAPTTGEKNRQVYVRDMHAGKTEIVSVSTQGDPGGPKPAQDTSQLLRGRGISANGRFVAFGSFASNLVPNDRSQLAPGTPTGVDIFVHDRQLGTTDRVSVTASGEEARIQPTQPFLSTNFTTGGLSRSGRYVSFAIANSSFSPKPSSMNEVYVHDRVTGGLDWVSVDPDSNPSSVSPQSNCFSTTFPGNLSFTGRYVAFYGCPDNLVKEDRNGSEDFFVRDRGPDLGVGGLVRSGALHVEGASSFSSTGIVERSDVASDVDEASKNIGGELTKLSLAYRPQHDDIYVAIRVGYMPPVLPGVSPLFYALRFDVEGMSYEVRATSSHGGTFGLFDCTSPAAPCTKIADLRGGYGTTGTRVVFSLPLRAIGLEDGGELGHVEAFSGLGSYDGGALTVLDTVRID